MYPARYLAPPMMDEAMLVVETGFTPIQLDEIPEALIQRMLIYTGVKQVTLYGGNYNP